MKKIGILGSQGTVFESNKLNTTDFLSRVGANTGNLVFQYAVYKAIKEDKISVGTDIPWDTNIVRENCRLLVVPSANFIRENFDISGYVNFLEKCKLPLLFLGIGAQADNYLKKDFNLHPSVLKLIELFKNSSTGVGVRGEYTGEILNNFGYKDSVIIGCPSNFLNNDAGLPDKIQKKWKSETITIATTGDEPWPKNNDKQIAERILFQWAFDSKGIYVQQSVDPLVRAIRGANPYDEVNNRDSLILNLHKALAPSIDIKDFTRFITSSVRLYSDIGQWMEDLSRFDLSIGLRLHGNMVPFQSGCPSIWIYHDSRTKELIDTMALPSISLDNFIELKDYNLVKSYCEFNPEKYRNKKLILRENYSKLYQLSNINFEL
jgi:hypothetical protein